MNELIYGKADVWWGRLFFFGACLLSAAIMIFCIAGIYNTFWGVPAKIERIAILERQVEVWQARSGELEKYIEKQQIALNFEGLFMLGATAKQVFDFGELNKYIEEKRHFCLDEAE